MDIDGGLEAIIEKYSLDSEYPSYRESRKAIQIVKEFVKAILKSDEHIAITGNDSIGLSIISEELEDSKQIDLIKYRQVGDKAFEECDWASYDRIYLISYKSAGDFFQYFSDRKRKVEWIYNRLEEHGIYLQDEFYRFFCEKMETVLDSLSDNDTGESVLLCEYYFQKKFFLNNTGEMTKRRTLKKLFFLAICMRNFVCAEEILGELRKYPNSEYWEKCWQEIKLFLAKIKEELNVQTKNHIILYWLDLLPYEDTLEMPYLQSRKVHSYYFTHAYTVTPFTSATAEAMFCGITQIDDSGYQMKRIEESNSPVLKILKQQGYQFRVISGYMGHLFEKKYHCKGTRKTDPSSLVLWNLINTILSSQKKTLFLAHLLIDTHHPTFNVGMENMYKNWKQRYSFGKREIDRQLEFYEHLINPQLIRIYMSDHGNTDIRTRFHIHFQVYQKDWNPCKVDGLYSHLDFQVVVAQLIKRGCIDMNAFNKTYVRIQGLDFYNPKKIGNFLKEHTADISFYLGYKGIITKDYFYIHYKCGTEWLIPWEKFQYIPSALVNDVYEESLINDFRAKAGDYPKSLEQGEKFRYSSYIYKAFENIYKHVEEMRQLLNKSLKSYPKRSIALRMGGWHSLRLYPFLSLENREKIGCIIDRKEDCEFSVLGLPVINPGEVLPKEIQVILLSSYIFLEDLKKEMKQLYGNKELLDIYQIFEANGFVLKREFMFGLEEDYNVGFPYDELEGGKQG